MLPFFVTISKQVRKYSPSRSLASTMILCYRVGFSCPVMRRRNVLVRSPTVPGSPCKCSSVSIASVSYAYTCYESSSHGCEETGQTSAPVPPPSILHERVRPYRFFTQSCGELRMPAGLQSKSFFHSRMMSRSEGKLCSSTGTVSPVPCISRGLLLWTRHGHLEEAEAELI